MTEERMTGAGPLPKGWIFKIFLAAAAALTGNYLMGILPWPSDWLKSFEEAMEQAAASSGVQHTALADTVTGLIMTLLAAPVLEEALFRAGIYKILRRFMGYLPGAVLSSLAFGIYHGNWIQGIYAFFLGMVLAWGYESSEGGPFLMTVLMHGAANLAALMVFH